MKTCPSKGMTPGGCRSSWWMICLGFSFVAVQGNRLRLLMMLKVESHGESSVLCTWMKVRISCVFGPCAVVHEWPELVQVRVVGNGEELQSFDPKSLTPSSLAGS